MKWILGWLGAGVLLAAAAKTVADEPQPAPATFDVILLTLKNDWQAMRYQTQSGETWYAFKGDWKPVPEAGDVKPPAGEYKLFLSATGDNDWIAVRLERKSGRSWRLAALKWIEMKVLSDVEPPPQPQQPPLPAPVTGLEAE